MSGLSRLRNMFRVPDLRNKVFFTVFIIFIFRVGSYIPVPYVPVVVTSVVVPVLRSRRKTSMLGWCGSFGTRSEASEEKATYRPSAEITGPPLP